MENKLEPIEKTSDGLRDALFDEINGVRTGARTLSQARVTSKLADQILILTRLEIEGGHQPFGNTGGGLLPAPVVDADAT